MPETLDFPNTNVEKAVKDITAGIKSVAANRMLDRMEEMYSSDEIIIRPTAFAPGAVLDIPSYFALFEPETDNEIHTLNEMSQYAPEEFYFEIYDDLITDDNIN